MSLELKNLTVRLGKATILDDISLSVPEGSFFSLLGPSGCGKSTLLKTIAGLLPQSGGEIWWDGAAIHHLPPEKRGMVLVFQDLRLFPHLSVLDNVAFPLKMAGEKKTARHAAAREMLAAVQLTGLEGRRPHQLSGGQQQRAVLARALVAKPKALLLDEPFSSLDAALRADMRALVRRLHQDTGTTMVLVTHDQQEALAMSDAMAVMAPGRILQTGTPKQLYETPKSLAVAQHFIQGNEVVGVVQEGIFRGGGLTIKAPADMPDGQAVALLPPESLTLRQAEGGFFTVASIEYCGGHQQVAVNTGEVTLHLTMPSGQAPPPLETVAVEVQAANALFFPAGEETPRL